MKLYNSVCLKIYSALKLFRFFLLSNSKTFFCIFNRTQQTEPPQAHQGRQIVQLRPTWLTSCPCNQVPRRLIPTWKVCMRATCAGHLHLSPCPSFPSLSHRGCIFRFPSTGSIRFGIILLPPPSWDLFLSGSGFLVFNTHSSWNNITCLQFSFMSLFVDIEAPQLIISFFYS